MGEVIEHAALRRARDAAAAATEREERLFAFAAVHIGLEREGNLAEAAKELRQCLRDVGLSEAKLREYLRDHGAGVIAFLDGESP